MASHMSTLRTANITHSLANLCTKLAAMKPEYIPAAVTLTTSKIKGPSRERAGPGNCSRNYRYRTSMVAEPSRGTSCVKDMFSGLFNTA